MIGFELAERDMTIITCPKCGTKNRVDETAGSLQPKCGKCGTPLSVPSAAESSHPLTVTDATFAQTIQDSRPVLIDFWASWCPPCRAIAPALEQLSAESGGRWVIAKMNVDENQATPGRFQIDGIPTLLIFKNGQLVDRLVGAHPKQTILQRLQAHA